MVWHALNDKNEKMIKWEKRHTSRKEGKKERRKEGKLTGDDGADHNSSCLAAPVCLHAKPHARHKNANDDRD
jgi:hypothetical protein